MTFMMIIHWGCLDETFFLQPEGGDLHQGLVLSLTLKSSMYATMALREITRTDTGKAQQRNFTMDHSKKDQGTEDHT